MYDTASPTVLRFCTSSSGILTPNFSSAATTTSTIDSESTSRSSVNDLSNWTSSAGMPATSLTMSASPDRISSVLAIWLAPSLFFSVVGWVSGAGGSGKHDDLGGVGEPRAEGDEEGRVSALRLARLEQRRGRQRDRRRRRVPLVGDVAGHDDVV